MNPAGLRQAALYLQLLVVFPQLLQLPMKLPERLTQRSCAGAGFLCNSAHTPPVP